MVIDGMGPRALARSFAFSNLHRRSDAGTFWLAPWSMAVDRAPPISEKSNRKWGVKGACTPWAASPSGGERGSPSHIATPVLDRS